MDTNIQKSNILVIKKILPYLPVLVFVLSTLLSFYISYSGYALSTENEENTEIVVTNIEGKKTNKIIHVPVNITIPSLLVDTRIIPVGITKSGNMASARGLTDVGWYKYGTVPGQIGSTVIAGHVDNALALDGVFKHLKEIKENSDIYIIMDDGTRLHFKVIYSEVYPYDKSPVTEIFNRNDKPRLNLITCAGTWNKSLKTYDQRLVVYTERVN